MTKNKGVALILSIIILTAVLAIALTAGKIFTDKIKMSRNTSDSMKAYYAAESGIEYALWKIKKGEAVDRLCPAWEPVDGAKYCLEKSGDSIKAIGKAGEARRGIEVQVASAAPPLGPNFYWTEALFDGANADTACASGYHMCNTSPTREWLDRKYNPDAPGALAAIFTSSEYNTTGRPAWVQPYTTTPEYDCNDWTSNSPFVYGTKFRFCFTGNCDSQDHPLSNPGILCSPVAYGDGISSYPVVACSNEFRVLCCSN